MESVVTGGIILRGEARWSRMEWVGFIFMVALNLKMDSEDKEETDEEGSDKLVEIIKVDE
jgi:hypothetical protein